MRVLYCNPIFFEYRLPFYKELVRLFKGQFYVMYSINRYTICGKSKFCKQIKEELSNNAIPFSTDYIFDTYSMSFKMKDIEKGNHSIFRLDISSLILSHRRKIPFRKSTLPLNR